MKNYRILLGILLFIVLHFIPGTITVFADPLGTVKNMVVKPSVVDVGGKTFTATSGDRVHVSESGKMPIMYDVKKNPDGSIILTSPEGDVTCSASGSCDDADFSAAIGGLTGVYSPGAGPRFVITSEKIPGSDCSCIADDGCKNPATKKYKCTVGEGLSGFQDMFASIIRYTVNIVLILSVLAIIGLGIAWTMAGGDDIKAKSSLKSWAINICIGLIILFFFRYILQFFAPWIYK